MNRILRLVFENFKRIGTDGRNAAEESSAGGRTDGGWRSTKRILSALLLSSSVFLSAEEWYRHTIPNGIEIISRAENGQKNFQPRRLEPSDDRVIIDFRDTHYNPKIFSRHPAGKRRSEGRFFNRSPERETHLRPCRQPGHGTFREPDPVGLHPHTFRAGRFRKLLFRNRSE